jgi:hypothetical protein
VEFDSDHDEETEEGELDKEPDNDDVCSGLESRGST